MELPERVARVLGGQAVLRRNVRTWADLERIITAGLPKRSLQLVAQRSVGPGESVNEFVYTVVPPATFKRRHSQTYESLNLAPSFVAARFL